MVCVFDEPLTDVVVLPGDLEADLLGHTIDLRRGMGGDGIGGGGGSGGDGGGGGGGKRLGEGERLWELEGDIDGVGEPLWLPPLDCASGDKNLSLSLLFSCSGSLLSSASVIFRAIADARCFRPSNPCWMLCISNPVALASKAAFSGTTRA